MADITGDVTPVKSDAAPGGEKPSGDTGHGKLDDVDFAAVPQAHLQKAFAIATGANVDASGGGGMEVDPAGVKSAMQKLEAAYDEILGVLPSVRELSELKPPGDEFSSKGYVDRANELGQQAYDSLKGLADHLKATYEAMMKQLTTTQASEAYNAAELGKQVSS